MALRWPLQNQGLAIKAGAWPNFSPKLPPSEKIGLSLGPGSQDSPQMQKPMEPTIFHEGLGPGLQLPHMPPWQKNLGMFWDLPAQSHLR